MSPLAPSNARGYADYQRLENFDSGVLYNLNAVVGVAGTASPVIDVSRYAYLGGQIGPQAGAFLCQFSWFADSGAIVLLGQRTVVFDLSIGNAAQLRFPNLAPFLQINAASLVGNATVRITVIGTNRVHPLEFIPMNPVLLDRAGVALGANATVAVAPSDYYAGPASCDFAANQGCFLAFDYLTTGSAWDQFYSQSVAANAEATPIVTTPAGAWRARIVNQTANAGSFSLRMVPTSTGAT